MKAPAFTLAANVLGEWRDEVLSGKPPTLYPGGEGDLARIKIGPGLVTLFGGPPGVGKTAFLMQLVVDALRLTPSLKALVANVEMPPKVLLDRQLARLSGVDLHTIRHRKLTGEHRERIDAGMAALADPLGRLAFLEMPFTLERVIQAGEQFDADVLVLDYLQRFAPPGDHSHKKDAVDASMALVRAMADCGRAVIVVAAVGRQRDEKGRSGYGGLNLASFRESSELEYGADDAFLLVPTKENDPTAVTLRHVKSRHGEPRDLALRFNGAVQRFDPAEDDESSSGVQDGWGKQPAGGDR
jgi:replicative DNA helicase